MIHAGVEYRVNISVAAVTPRPPEAILTHATGIQVPWRRITRTRRTKRRTTRRRRRRREKTRGKASVKCSVQVYIKKVVNTKYDLKRYYAHNGNLQFFGKGRCLRGGQTHPTRTD